MCAQKKFIVGRTIWALNENGLSSEVIKKYIIVRFYEFAAATLFLIISSSHTTPYTTPIYKIWCGNLYKHTYILGWNKNFIFIIIFFSRWIHIGCLLDTYIKIRINNGMLDLLSVSCLECLLLFIIIILLLARSSHVLCFIWERRELQLATATPSAVYYIFSVVNSFSSSSSSPSSHWAPFYGFFFTLLSFDLMEWDGHNLQL